MSRLALFLLILPQFFPAAAQQRTGAITGIILDGSGGAVGGAHVRLDSPSTGLRRETLTDSSGVYTLALLPVGSHDVSVSAQGFQTQVRAALAVSVNETLRIDFQLSVAAQETSVNVTAEAPLVNTADATTGAVVQSRQIVELPLNGRNFTQLGLLIPGAVPTPQRLGGASSNSAFSVNGQRTQSNNFLLDGVSNNDTLSSGFVIVPPPDSLEQFKMVTHNYAAEYGQNSGSVVTAITRAGTNKIHASFWDFLRNDALDARNFFSRSKPPLRQNQFGASGGAPLVKDRTFVFGYYEGVKASEGLVNNVVVLSDLERAGNYSASSVKPRDPLTNQPFPDNVIPASRIDPAARAIVDRYVPRSNSAGNRYLAAPARNVTSHQYGIRGDHRFAGNNSLFLRYSYSQNENFNPLGPAAFSPAGSAAKDFSHGAVISDTHVFSPGLLNEASFSFLRQFSLPVTRSGVSPADLGFRYTPTESTAIGIPFVTLSGLFTVGDAGQAFTQIARNNYQFNDNLTLLRGRHALKMGFDFQRSQIFLVFPNRPNGDFTINGSGSGNVTADLLLGRAAQFRQGGGDPSKHFFGSTYGFYFQDDWKVSRRLTLNLGARYDLGLPYYDKYDRVASFQPGTKSTVRPAAPANLLFPGDANLTRSTIQTDKNNIAARFGFAYDPGGNGNTSIRGGYGIFYDAIPGVAVFQNINVPPFNRFIQVDGVPSFTNPYQNYPANPQTDPSRNFPCPCLVIGFSPDLRSPYAQHWNLSLQRRLPFQLLLEAGYVGSSGVKFPGYREVNPAVPGPGATFANTQARRLYKDYNLIRPTFGDFNSNYHAFQTRLEKRYSSGLQMLLSYTYSKAIDFQSSVNLGDPRPQNAFSMSDIRGLAIFDTRQRFVASYGYELPFRFSSKLLQSGLGGWLLQGIVSAQSGNPLTATESVDLSLRGLGADRPDQIADPNDGPKTPQRFFSTAAFQRLTATPGGQRSGTAGRNTIIGPGLLQADLAALKRFALYEAHTLEFRAELFNAFNNVNFLNPLTNIGAPQTFGVIQQARPARIIQFGLKYAF
jgi:outer membrane receptor protein involved in Fe transport